jgi:hypothetical protein
VLLLLFLSLAIQEQVVRADAHLDGDFEASRAMGHSFDLDDGI